MPVSFSPSRFSLRRTHTSRPVSLGTTAATAATTAAALDSTTTATTAASSASDPEAPRATSSPTPADTASPLAERPGLSRLHSSGSIRRAHPARSRAAHPDDLDLTDDLDADDNESGTPGHDSRSPDPPTGHAPLRRPDPPRTTSSDTAATSRWIIAKRDRDSDATARAIPRVQLHPPPPSSSPPRESFPGSALAPLAEEEMEDVEPAGQSFQGLSDYALDLGKNRRLIDEDYLKTAFGITMSRRASEEQIRRERASGKHESIPLVPPLPADLVGSPASEKSDFFEMDVPLALDPRPIVPLGEVPRDNDYHTAPVEESTAADSKSEDSDEPESTTSSVSTLKQARLAQQLHGETATAVAIISPDQILESPKPRRPFSTVSIEGMTNAHPKKPMHDQPLKSAASNSSEDTNAQDVLASERSTDSSKSSVASPPENSRTDKLDDQNARRQQFRDADRLQSLDESDDVVTPMAPTDALSPLDEIDDTTSMYHTALTSRGHSRSNSSSKRLEPPMETRRKNSETSLISSFSAANMNVNKPLPPEPGRKMATLSHISEQSNESQTSLNTLRPDQSHQHDHQRSQKPQKHGHHHHRSRTTGDIDSSPNLRPSSNMQRADSRGSTLSGWSLRSKYSPNDLDAMDTAFVQDETRKERTPPSPVAPVQTPSRRMQSMAVSQNSHLDVIREASPAVNSKQQDNGRQHRPSLSDPSQRTRGPSRTESGRRGTNPSSKTSTRKNSLISLYNEKNANRSQQPTQRSQGSSRPGSQERLNEDAQRKQPMMVVTPSSKANRVLGKSPTDSSWGHSESPDSSSSPHPNGSHSNASRENFRSPNERPVDTHFAEIQQRMQLLHPKEPSHEHLAPENPNAQHVSSGNQGRRKRLTPLAELPAQASPQIGSLPSGNGQQSIQTTQFVPPPPPPPPLSDTPPPIVERRGRGDGFEPTSAFSRSTMSQRSTKARSIASLVASEIPDIYACINSNATNSVRPSMTAEETEQMISAEAAERVLYRILQNLHSFRDLFAAAQVSRGFYRTFKRHELSLLKSALYRMSPPAWELREISIPRLELLEDGTDYMPNLYFSHYMRDMATLTELKSLILEYCKPYLRSETVRDLSTGPEQHSKIDAAFWRVWSFCKIFGGGNQREHDMMGQMDWLKGGQIAHQSFQRRRAAVGEDTTQRSIILNPPAGFARGNGRGLTADELYDMTEVWTCLGALVRGYLEQLDLAWEFGVFDRVNISRGDSVRENALLEEWTHYLLTRGPQAVLRAAAPVAPTAEQYARVKADSLTEWRPMSDGSSRSMFLKEALSHVYDEQMRETRPLLAASPKGFSDLPQVVSPGIVPTFSPSIVQRDSIAQQGYGAAMQGEGGFTYQSMSAATEPRTAPVNAPPMVPIQPPMHLPISGPQSAPMSNFHETLSKLDSLDTGGATQKSKGSKFASRLRAKPNESADQRILRKNVEALVSPASNNDGVSPIGPSPGANTFKPQNKGARLANLKSKVTGKTPRTPTSAGATPHHYDSKHSLVSLPSMPSIDNVSLNTQSETLASRGSGDQGEDPIAPMIDQLVNMGFEEPRARKALNKNTKNNFIDFEQALASLVKQREIRKKMERLDRMG